MHSKALISTEVKNDLCTARVVLLSEGAYLCESEGRRYKAKKSHDCLLIPQMGDTVLLFRSSASIYILNVLERGPVKNHLYHFPGNSAFMMEENFVQSCGNYRLQTRDYALQSDDVSVESKHFALRADAAGIEAKTLNVKTTLLRKQAERVYNFVTHFEHQVLGRLRTIVKKGLRIEAEETHISSQGITQIDGEHIHLG